VAGGSACFSGSPELHFATPHHTQVTCVWINSQFQELVGGDSKPAAMDALNDCLKNNVTIYRHVSESLQGSMPILEEEQNR
jgi:hypothetical protein